MRFFWNRSSECKQCRAKQARIAQLELELEDERSTILTVVSNDPRLDKSVMNFLSTEIESLQGQLASRQ